MVTMSPHPILNCIPGKVQAKNFDDHFNVLGTKLGQTISVRRSDDLYHPHMLWYDITHTVTETVKWDMFVTDTFWDKR